jgi:hypothetical protein
MNVNEPLWKQTVLFGQLPFGKFSLHYLKNEFFKTLISLVLSGAVRWKEATMVDGGKLIGFFLGNEIDWMGIIHSVN